ncbi:MAG: hypothetical protein NTX91_05260 [candidate division SR1 bacterium]|nr:hypothetical protein [candidate division SR1 bacterium]
MVNVVKKEQWQLSNNQMHPFFESLSQKDGFSGIDWEIRDEIYDVLGNNVDHRFDEKYIKEKIAGVLKKNPNGTIYKDAEELYKEYKEFLNKEIKEKETISRLVDKIVPICKADETYEFEKTIGDENYENNFRKRIGNIIKKHVKLAENEQKLRNLDILIQSIKTSKGKRELNMPEKVDSYSNPIGCLLTIAEQCTSEEQAKSFGYLYYTGCVIEYEPHLESLISFVKEKNTKYFEDKTYFFDQYTKIYGNIREYEIGNLCNGIEQNSKNGKMEMQNAFTSATIIAYILEKAANISVNGYDPDRIDTLTDSFYISELKDINAGDVIFVAEKIKQSLKSGNIENKEAIKLRQIISLINLCKKYRYTDTRIQEMDIKINEDIKSYNDLIEEMFFYIYGRKTYTERYSSEKEKEEGDITAKYTLEKLEDKVPDFNEILKYFNISLEPGDFRYSSYDWDHGTKETISLLYFLDNNPNLKEYIRDNFKIEKIHDLTDTLQRIKGDIQENKEYKQKLDVIKQFYHGKKMNLRRIDALLDKKYSLEFIQRLIQMKEDTGYDIIAHIEKDNYASSKLSSIIYRFEDQETYQKAKEAGFFTELNDRSSNHTSKVYEYRNIKNLVDDKEFLKFLSKNNDIGFVNIAMENDIEEGGWNDNERKYVSKNNHLRNLYIEEEKTDFKLFNIAKKIGFFKPYSEYYASEAYCENDIKNNIIHREDKKNDIKKMLDTFFKGDEENFVNTMKEHKQLILVLGKGKQENLNIAYDIVNNVIDLIKLKNILVTANDENFKIIIEKITKNIDNLVMFEKILQNYKPEYLNVLIKLFTETKNGLTIEKQAEYLQNMETICQRDREYVENFVKRIQENKKGFAYGYFVEATKNSINTKNNTINRENFLEYMDNDTQLLTFDQDSLFTLDETTPRTKGRFLENPKRKDYLKPEIMETFRKFGTILGLGILEGAESSENLKKFYEYIFTNISPEESRNSILQLGEVFSVLLKQGKYKILDEIVDKEANIGEEFKNFIEKYKISEKGRTILTLMIARAINSSFAIWKKKDKEGNKESEKNIIDTTDIKIILLGIFEKFKKYNKIIKKYDEMPIKTSIGIEYEVTKSIAEGYKNTTQGEYKKDIETLSAYSGISRGNDAVHEIATKPTENPYLLLLELKLLEDLDFIDLNFKNENYEKGGRTVHITLGGEYGISCDKNTNFIQNILNVSNLGGINLGEDVEKINRYSNIRGKGSDCEAIFSNKKTECTEYRSLDINKAEQFERLLISIFNLNMAKETLDKYTKKEFIDNRKENRFNFVNIYDFKKYAKEQDIRTENVKDEKIYTLIYEFLDLQNDILEIVDDHNKNFLANETISTKNSIAFDELIHLVQNKRDAMLYMKMMNVDIKYLSSLINKNIESEEDFFEQLKNDGKDIKNISEDKERYTVEGEKMKLTNAKKIVYFSYKKNIKPTLERLQKENPRIFENISKYFENQDIEELERKRRNRTRLDDEFRKTKKTPEEYLKSIQIDKKDFFEIITPELVNKFTHMNNFFLKQDSTNASSMFDATKESDGETITDRKSAETSIFDKIDQKIPPRNGYNYIQGASEKMITQAIQKRILEFNEKILQTLSNNDKIKKIMNTSQDQDVGLVA